ncbi:MAG: TfoX/Sxy family protein [Clostridia bacterium]|nr:TfoX/Sxy family protein [Clostridia bacterium]
MMSHNPTPLASLRNIGKEIAKKLQSVDIPTAEELKRVGSKEAFFRLKTLYPNVCLVTLYALEGALTDTEYNQLPQDVKQNLKAYGDSLK